MTGKIERNDEEIVLELTYYYNAAQDGGRDDPSWDEYATLESAIDAYGHDWLPELEPSEIERLETEIIERIQEERNER